METDGNSRGVVGWGPTRHNWSRSVQQNMSGWIHCVSDCRRSSWRILYIYVWLNPLCLRLSKIQLTNLIHLCLVLN